MRTKDSGRFVKISGIGSYVPERILTNNELEKMVDTSDEWIQTRTGIKERRIAADNQATSDLCVLAAQRAMESAKISRNDIDLILVGTITSDMPFPSTAVIVQSKLGLSNIPCFDYNVACSGTQYGIELASSLLTGSRKYRNILLICGDKMSSVVDWQDRATCVLLGDGAGAMVLSVTENGEENSIVDVLLGANGGLWELLFLAAGGSKEPASFKTVENRKHFLRMSGRDVFREAVLVMQSCAQEILSRNNMTIEEIDFVVPHQANLRIITALQERLGVFDEKICITVDKYGNTSASSCLIAMDTFVKSGKIRRGSKILSMGFGAGLTWGAAILKF
ncbi:MAG: ketoacyl-ACP synthase III [Puniceicoccales bacterium]|jgi:3-oxoacyl-[acyl-carrier-protein] synthase-3|nr:ketoacyl-ACP synthase III [Puniceicoccales bacterium]